MSDFHGMALHLERKEGEWHVRVNVQAVFSPVLQVGLRANRSAYSITGEDQHGGWTCNIETISSICLPSFTLPLRLVATEHLREAIDAVVSAR